MDLLTVTCNRDFQQMVLQAESISRFVEPCTHWVIINEPESDIAHWNYHLKPFYKNHMLKVRPRVVESANENGWYTQQLQKIAAAKIIQKDYLVLDSKNFFIRNIDTDTYQNILGSGRQVLSSSFNKNNQRFLSYCSDILNKPIPEKLLAEFTPFVIKYKPIEDILKKHTILELIPDYKNLGKYKVSEFLIYSMLIQDLDEYKNFNEPICSYNTIWGSYPDSTSPEYHSQKPIITVEELKSLTYSLVNSNIKLIGFHRRLLSDPTNIAHINKILGYLHFKTKLNVI
jgi:hypothetical protein